MPTRRDSVGMGFPPDCESQGSERVPPAALSLFPNGAEKYIWVPASIIARSPYIPYAARMVMRPLPSGSQASPTRGKNLSHTGPLMYFPLVYCGSPGKTNPAGAFVNTLL